MVWVTALKARGSTSRSGPAVPQARAGSECLRVLGVQALASPQSGRFADVSLDTTRSHRASFRFLAHAGPFGVWQLKVRCVRGSSRSTTLASSMLWVTALKARGSTSRLGPAVPQAPVLVLVPPGTRVQALASPLSGRFADVSPTLRVRTAPPFRLLAHAGPLGVWQLRCDASEARVVSTPFAVLSSTTSCACGATKQCCKTSSI